MEGDVPKIEVYFKWLHTAEGVGRNHKDLLIVYRVLKPHAKTEFKSLSVEKQIFLLAVPLEKQATFKRQGIDVYENLNK